MTVVADLHEAVPRVVLDDALGISGAAEPAGQQDAPPGFFRRCRVVLLVGLGLPLLLGPITAWPGDVYVWYERVTQASVGVHLYALPGFSYPPVWGYVLGAFGLVAHLTHAGPGVFGSTNPLYLRVTSDFLPPVITSIAFDAALKAVLVAMELASAWFLWRLVMLLEADAAVAKRAVVLFVFSPIVLVSVGVHGAFDVMVALLVLAALVARLEGRPFIAGALVAAGALAKIEPAFLAPLLAATWLWPLHDEASEDLTPRRRLAGLAGFAAGGAVAGAVLLAPVVADRGLGSLVVDVFTRSSGPTGLGGLGLTGLLQLPGLGGLASLLEGRENHLVGVGLEAALLASMLAVVVLWAAWRRRTGRALVGLACLVGVMTLLVSPVTQPQYLVWLVGPLCALACSRLAMRRLLALLGAAGAVYLLGIAGPLLVLAPLLVRIGATGVLTSSTKAFGRSLVLGLSPGELATDVACVASVVALVALGVLVVQAVRREPRSVAAAATQATSREPAAPGAKQERRPPRRAFVLLGAALICCEGLSAVPLPSALPLVVVGESSGAPGTVLLHVSASSHGTLRDDVVAFAASRDATVRRVAFYEDIAYPDSGSTWSETIGVENNLEALARADKLSWRFSTVGTSGLRRLLLDRREAPGTVLVMTNGVLPGSVFSRSLDLVRPWLSAGGTLVWTGDVPGYYASGPNAELATFTTVGSGASQHKLVHFSPGVQVLGLGGAGRLIGHGGELVIGRWYAPARRPSAWEAALHLAYPYDHVGPALDKLAAWHGMALGYENGSTVSISFLRVGGGGILLFGGFTFASVVASDTARILESGCLGASGPPAAASLRPGGHRTLTVSVPTGARRIALLTFNPLVPDVVASELPVAPAGSSR